MALLTWQADWGHCTTQRIHEIHFLLSAIFGFSLLIACAGHCLAQRPQLVQSLPALGTRPVPPVGLKTISKIFISSHRVIFRFTPLYQVYLVMSRFRPPASAAPTTSGICLPRVIPMIAAVLAIMPRGRLSSITITHFSFCRSISYSPIASFCVTVQIPPELLRVDTDILRYIPSRVL